MRLWVRPGLILSHLDFHGGISELGLVRVNVVVLLDCLNNVALAVQTSKNGRVEIYSETIEKSS